MKNRYLKTIIIVALLIVAAYFGYYILKFAIGLVAAILVFGGGYVGFEIGRCFPRKKSENTQQ